MPSPAPTGVLRYIYHMAAGADRGESDEALLRGFVARRDEAAFAALLRRHGSLVYGACQQVLGEGPDAEDCFQATFLMLARKASSVRRGQALGAWLHRVAINLACTARAARARRRSCEREAARMIPPASLEGPAVADRQPVLHEEVNRLPEKYRTVVVSCYLQGQTNEEAARQLGCPVGTVKGRLARARELLRDRLTRRGLTLGAAGAAGLLEHSAATAGVPAGLAHATVRAALAFAAGKAATAPAVLLARAALSGMALRRLALAGWLVLLTIAVGGGLLTLAGASATVPPAEVEAPAAPRDDGAPAEVAAVAQPAAPAEPETPWGDPVDGLAARIVLAPRFTVGQAITAVIEVKNTTDRKRYIVPRLDPQFKESLAVQITGPKGEVRQVAYSGIANVVSENMLKPIEPGAIERFVVADLRRYFSALEAWQCYPNLKGNDVPPGKYVAQFRFKSPKVGPKLYAGQSQTQGGPLVTHYKDTPPELLANHWGGELRSAPVTFQLAPLEKEDLAVHEWGVFTVFNEAKFANADRKEEWGGLPSFFYRQFPTERIRWVPSAWDKPIVYFYAKPAALRLNVTVSFPDGAPVVWWPAAADPIDTRTIPEPGKTPAKGRPFRSLTWEAWTGDQLPPGMFASSDGPVLAEVAKGPPKLKDFPLPDDCWLRHARLASASRLTVIGNHEGWPQKRPRFPGAKDRHETERFLYYDGLVPTPDYLRCEKVDAASVTLRNRAKFDMTRLFVVDRRIEGKVGFAVIDAKEPLKASTQRTIVPAPIAAADWPAAGVKAVRAALLDAGLFAPEADALLKIWQKRLLQAEGVAAFQILPADEYDRMLPLSVLPKPATRPVRVGIALHPHVEVEPALAAHVAALVRQLDEDDFVKRDAASRALLEIGPLAVTLLRAELQKRLPLETHRRIEAVLDRVDASVWLGAPAAPAK
jgi:RNA polymerase sigma factor (sigma-70 family)